MLDAPRARASLCAHAIRRIDGERTARPLTVEKHPCHCDHRCVRNVALAPLNSTRAAGQAGCMLQVATYLHSARLPRQNLHGRLGDLPRSQIPRPRAHTGSRLPLGHSASGLGPFQPLLSVWPRKLFWSFSWWRHRTNYHIKPSRSRQNCIRAVCVDRARAGLC